MFKNRKSIKYHLHQGNQHLSQGRSIFSQGNTLTQ